MLKKTRHSSRFLPVCPTPPFSSFLTRRKPFLAPSILALVIFPFKSSETLVNNYPKRIDVFISKKGNIRVLDFYKFLFLNRKDDINIIYFSLSYDKLIIRLNFCDYSESSAPSGMGPLLSLYVFFPFFLYRCPVTKTLKSILCRL